MGYSQRPGIDYGDIYAAVPRLKSFRVFISLVASEGFDMVQIDIKTAFLNAVLDCPVYMTQPEGFVVPGKEDWPVLLNKALYGTKQASVLWGKTFKKTVEKQASKR